MPEANSKCNIWNVIKHTENNRLYFSAKSPNKSCDFQI